MPKRRAGDEPREELGRTPTRSVRSQESSASSSSLDAGVRRSGDGSRPSNQRSVRSSVALQILARHDQVDHAVLEQELRALEAGRQLLADRLLDHARAGEADQRIGLGDG